MVSGKVVKAVPPFGFVGSNIPYFEPYTMRPSVSEGRTMKRERAERYSKDESKEEEKKVKRESSSEGKEESKEETSSEEIGLDIIKSGGLSVGSGGKYDEHIPYIPQNGMDEIVLPYSYRSVKYYTFNTVGQTLLPNIISGTLQRNGPQGMISAANAVDTPVGSARSQGFIYERSRWKVIPNGNINLWLSDYDINLAVGRGAVAWRIRQLRIVSRGARWSQVRSIASEEQIVGSAPWLGVYKDENHYFRTGVSAVADPDNPREGNGKENFSENDYAVTDLAGDRRSNVIKDLRTLRWLGSDYDDSSPNRMPDPMEIGNVEIVEPTANISWVMNGGGEWISLLGINNRIGQTGPTQDAFSYPLEGFPNAMLRTGAYNERGGTGDSGVNIGFYNNAYRLIPTASMKRHVDLLAVTMPTTINSNGFTIDHTLDFQLHYEADVEFYYCRSKNKHVDSLSAPYGSGIGSFSRMGQPDYTSSTDASYELATSKPGSLFYSLPSAHAEQRFSGANGDYTFSNGLPKAEL